MKSGEAGFTLMELLVAMTAASLLLASLTWTVSRLGRQIAGPREGEAISEIAALRPVIASLVGAARTDGDGALQIDRREVRFVTAAPGNMGGARPVAIRLRSSGPPGNRHLEGVITPVEGPIEERRFRSVHGWRNIAFSRIGNEDAPLVLRIDFTGARGTQGIIAATHVNTRGDCVFDPISMACRP